MLFLGVDLVFPTVVEGAVPISVADSPNVPSLIPVS